MSLPKIVLFGDSHTQRSFEVANGAWGALLTDRFQRIADVVPRGFSGYNSRWCRLIAPKVFSDFPANRVAAVVILLGSNDSSHADSPSGQHVPLEEFKNNLGALIDYFESCNINQNRIILLSPPNYHDEVFLRSYRESGKTVMPRKSDQATREYAHAVKAVAKDRGVTFLDVYSIFSAVEHNNSSLFVDGLHLSSSGGRLLFDHLLPLVMLKVEQFIGYPPTDQAMQFPYWADIDISKPEKSLLP